MDILAGIASKIYEIVAQILLQLGANETVYIQVAIFIVTISVLTIFVFSPFFAAADIRYKKTKGADQVAKEAAGEAKNLQLVYQTKAREINNKIKDIFDIKKTEGQKLTAEILSQAKKTAELKTEASRKNIEEQTKVAELEIEKISKDLSETLVQNFEKGL